MGTFLYEWEGNSLFLGNDPLFSLEYLVDPFINKILKHCLYLENECKYERTKLINHHVE